MNFENLKVYTTHKEWDKGVGVGIVARLRLSVVHESEVIVLSSFQFVNTTAVKITLLKSNSLKSHELIFLEGRGPYYRNVTVTKSWTHCMLMF